MGNSLSIGLSALLAAQKAIDLAGNNVANAATPNYSRRRVDLAPTAPGRTTRLASPAGVSLVRIEAIRDQFIDRALLSQDPLAGAATRRAQFLAQAEAIFSTDPEGSLGAALDGFFNSLRELARNPSGGAERDAVVANAQNLTASFRSVADQLAAFRNDLAPHIAEVVDTVNTLSAQIADLNSQIRDTVISGGEAHDLIDQRYNALRQLAELVPITTTEDSLSRVDVRSGGVLLVSKSPPTQLTTVANGRNLEVRVGDSGVLFRPTSGQLGALLDLHSTTIPDYLARLDTLAATLVRQVNQCHATGVGSGGSFAALSSTVAVADSAAPLNRAGLPWPLSDGALYVSVVDEATGDVVQSQVAFNPNFDSLEDLAAALDGIGHLDASVSSGLLNIRAQSGYRFDFTSKVPTRPGALGSAAVVLDGTVALDANDTYTFAIDASGTPGGPGSGGTIGTTPGLRVRVTNAAGATVALLDVGEGYRAGQPLPLPGGFTAAFDAGDVADGDALAVPLAAEPDAQGLLAALGVNALLRGNSAASFGLEPDIAADPTLIAAGCSGASGDNANALRLADLADLRLEALGGETVSGFLSRLIGKVGTDAAAAQRVEQSTLLLRDAAENQREAVSGVNQDEEAVNLIRFQQIYQFASRYIKTIDDLMNLLLST